MKKVAEGELLIHTQKSGQNVDRLRAYLASLRAESQRTSVGMDSLAKSILQAGARGLSLGKVVKGLASAAGFGGLGVAAYLAIDKMTRGLIDAQEESDKLAESLNKAIGARAEDSIAGTTSKLDSLTKTLNEAKSVFSNQDAWDKGMAAIGAFISNKDVNAPAKAYERAALERIKLGDKLVAQEELRVAQQKVLMRLDDDAADSFKINIETRNKLRKIDDDESLTSQQKKKLADIAREEGLDKLKELSIKKQKEADKKIADDKRKTEEDFARASIKITDSLIKQEQELFEKGVKDFKDSQEEKIKAAEEANRQLVAASKKAIDKVKEQDDQARKDTEDTVGGDVGVLLASKAGSQALDQARKVRAQKNPQENFRTQEAILSSEAERLSKAEGKKVTMQDVRVRMATRVAATEMPTLGEKLAGTAAGIEPAQVARSRSEAVMASNKQGAPDIMKSIETILNKLSSAPLVTSGAGGS